MDEITYESYDSLCKNWSTRAFADIKNRNQKVRGVDFGICNTNYDTPEDDYAHTLDMYGLREIKTPFYSSDHIVMGDFYSGGCANILNLSSWRYHNESELYDDVCMMVARMFAENMDSINDDTKLVARWCEYE